MLLPLNAVWLAAHGAYRALGFRSRLVRTGSRTVHLHERRGAGIPSCGHLPMVEQSAWVGARIARFLRELS